ncbi:MAG TPA: sigma 54-interacting transcriptional regulator [Candidatus Kapabacteria bacterium]|nr:sigma 54-interacting transcriptional regulator [Candidatus Kapabacteria bacterium]
MISVEPSALVSLFDQPAIFIDRQYRILASNGAYQQRYGVPKPDCHCFQASHGYSSPCHANGEPCPLLQSQQTGTHARALHIHQDRDHRHFCQVEMHPVQDSSGATVGFIEIMNAVESASVNAGNKGLIGESPAFQKMMEAVYRVAPTDVSVLLEGESGTGKELVARAIHDASNRKLGKFVVLECSGINENLFESELFGYRKGAFTGARSDKTGLAASASGGTLFLDEVGDIPINLQVKLLRLLETGAFRPVGATEMERTDFRLICASHKNVKAMVEAGTFREDLYYRLATFPIHLPPLRERREDLALLCEAMLGRPPVPAGTHVSNAVIKQLARYRFPGNIRELRNLIIRASLLAEEHVIQTKHLPPEIAQQTAPRDKTHFAENVLPLEQIELDYLRHIQEVFEGSSAELALKLGISERTLYRKLARLKSNTVADT